MVVWFRLLSSAQIVMGYNQHRQAQTGIRATVIMQSLVVVIQLIIIICHTAAITSVAAVLIRRTSVHATANIVDAMVALIFAACDSARLSPAARVV